jgi:hypothetical protein
MALPLFVRVKDVDTKHEYDVRETSVLIRDGKVDVVKSDRYPPSPYPRPAKHHVAAKKLAKAPASRQTPEPSGDGTPNPQES